MKILPVSATNRIDKIINSLILNCRKNILNTIRFMLSLNRGIEESYQLLELKITFIRSIKLTSTIVLIL